MGQCASCGKATPTKDEETKPNATDEKVAKESTRLNHVESTQADRRNETKQQETKSDPQGRKDEVLEANPKEQGSKDVEDDVIQADAQQHATEVVAEIEESEDLGREVATSQDDASSLSEDEIEQDILVETMEREKGNTDNELQEKQAEGVGIVNGAKVLLDIPKLKKNLPKYFGWSAASMSTLYVLSLLPFELLSFLAIDLFALVVFSRQREIADAKNALVAATGAGASCDTELENMNQGQVDVGPGTSAAELEQPESTTETGGQTKDPAIHKSVADGGEEVEGMSEKIEGEKTEVAAQNPSVRQTPSPENGGHESIVQYERRLAKKVVNHMKMEKDACRTLYRSLDQKDPPAGTLTYDQLRLFFDGLEIGLRPPEVATLVSCIRKKRPGRHDEHISLQEAVACLKSYYASTEEP